VAPQSVIDDLALSSSDAVLATSAAAVETSAAPPALGDAFTVVLAAVIAEIEGDAQELVRVAAAVPLDVDSLLALQAGYEAGAGEGFTAGWNALAGTVSWLHDAGFSIIAAAIDDGFQIGLGQRIIDDIVAGDDLPADVLAFIDSRYPALADIARGCLMFARLVDALDGFARSVAAEGLFVTLFRTGVRLGSLIADAADQTFHELIREFVSLEGKPFEQGRMIGRPCGRVGFEIVLQVALAGVGSALKGAVSAAAVSVEAASGAEAMLAAVDSTRAGEILSETAVLGETTATVEAAKSGLDAARVSEATVAVAPTVRTRFAIREWRGPWTLEKMAAEVYLDLAYANVRYGSLSRRTGMFNALYRVAAGLGGWDARSVIRLDAHHIIESRMLKALRSDARFTEAFVKLGWASKLDMPATALETEFHIRTGSSLAKEFELDKDAEKYIVESRSLSYILEKQIGSPTRFKSFEELLNAYEAFYRAPVEGTGPGGEIVRLHALWPRVEETFVRIRTTLGLPPLP